VPIRQQPQRDRPDGRLFALLCREHETGVCAGNPRWERGGRRSISPVSAAATLATVVAVYVPAALTPGPNVLLIVRTASAGSRRAALCTASGVVVAGAVLATGAVLGLAVVFAQAPWLSHGLRLCCGLYLALLGVRLWRQADKVPTLMGVGTAADVPWAAFRRGLLVNLGNPKAAAFFGSVLTAALPPSEPLGLRFAAIAAIVTCSAAWHTTLALAFSAERARHVYLRAKPVLDRAVAGVLVTLGAVLAFG
jgi:threonine/homoserine/homoserine lactone efflux protein